jgi:hypothetical protein
VGGGGAGRLDQGDRHSGQPPPHRALEPAPDGRDGVRAAQAGGGGEGEIPRRKAVLPLRAARREPELPGLEGALLRTAAEIEPQKRDVRRLVRRLGLDDRGPWNTVCNHCFAEAHTAGLVEQKGRLFKKIAFTDRAAVEALRERNDELRAARGAYLDAEPELTGAVISDCLRAVIDAYSPDLGD